MKRQFMLLLMVFSIATAYTQNIVTAEYFFDSDPGCGNGTAISIPASSGTVNFTTNIPSNMLSAGFHLLAVRVRDADGKWSMFDRRGIYISTPTSNTGNITAAEYFYDNDPGAGNGTPVSVGTPGDVVNFAALIPAPMNAGFHFLAIRTRDADGKWGMFERRGFYISPPPVDMPVITAAEYFYDNDPGAGNGTPLAISSPGNTITQNFMVPVPAQMTAGGHLLAIRVKDQAGNWSLFEKDSLTIGAVSASISCPGNITVNALPDQCEALVNNLDPVITPQGSSYTYTLTGATTGNGNGSASGRLFNAGVTTVTYSLASSPEINCSFTVTVNPGATTSVSVYTPVTSICSGSEITFFATPVNGGFTPLYQWKKNGINVGSNSNRYTDSTLVNGDVITVVMTSSLSCANPVTVTSNPITMSVTETVTPSVSISASATSICPGQQVTFTATSTNGGNNPTYQWIWNGNFGGSNSTYQSSSLADGDSVFLWFNSSASCINYSMVRSNAIYITASQSVSPMVTISASATSICTGQPVTFTASPTNGGNMPTFQWKLNGSNVGTNSSSYQNSGLANGDMVTVEMTSSLNCASPSNVTSNTIIMSVGSTVEPSVSISASATSICAGQPVTFTATPTNGGIPTYQWKLNGLSVGINSNVYQNSGLENGDMVTLEMTSSLSCASPSKVTSNTIIMSVGSTAEPSVSISASATSICAGQPVTFTATPTNGGSPIYQWKLNGLSVGTNSNVYQYSGLADGDEVTVDMTSSLTCASPSKATSNAITMSVVSTVEPSVSISASAVSVCAGSLVLLTANPTNGGNTPNYQWKVNGVNVGTGGNTYQSTSFANADAVSVVMTSSLACASPRETVSNSINILVQSRITYYRDVDGDGYGSIVSGTTEACTQVPGYSLVGGDCNDNDPSVNPGSAEICGNNGDDNCSGTVDEYCTTDLPQLTMRTYPVKEGDGGQTIVITTLTLDRPAPLEVQLNYETVNEDAVAGLDYIATNGVLTIPAGAISVTVPIHVIGDLLRESNERFWIQFSNPVNVNIGTEGRCKFIIIDDDKGKRNHSITSIDNSVGADESFKIPTVARANQTWIIPQIERFENEILIMNVQGQVVSRFVNYRNNIPLGDLSTGIYFYRIRVKERNGQIRYFTGRLLITE